LTKDEVRARIQEIGIIPAARVSSAEEARFAANAVFEGGIAIVEIPLTVPDAVGVISEVSRQNPQMIAGAGSVDDIRTARLCLEAGARFLTTDALDLAIVDFAVHENVVVLAGAMTPTEVLSAWRAKSDFVKVFPCGPLGGEQYIRALKSPFPNIPLVAAGGVNQRTALGFILAGAIALGVGKELIPREAIERRNVNQIRELARRFLGFVHEARVRLAPRRTGITLSN